MKSHYQKSRKASHSEDIICQAEKLITCFVGFGHHHVETGDVTLVVSNCRQKAHKRQVYMTTCSYAILFQHTGHG